jgi:hypothetical protein
MTRINLFRSLQSRTTTARNAASKDSVAWGKTNISETGGALLFAALLVACSLAVGCSNDNPKVSASNNQAPTPPIATPTNSASPNMSAPISQTVAKAAPKKVVRKRPATVTYVDKTYGVSFEYPRRYALETGDAAIGPLSSSTLPMNFIGSGGTALATVELPETGFDNTDFSSAFFNMSVNKAISAEDCGKFSVPQTAAAEHSSQSAPTSSDAPVLVRPEQTASAPAEKSSEKKDTVAADAKAEANKPAETTADAKSTTDVKPASDLKTADTKPASSDPSNATSSPAATAPAPKVLLSEMETQKTEAVSGQGNRQSDSKYYHVYQNGACYEFSLNLTTVAQQADGEMKHVDRDKVFGRLDKIMATVKINPVETEKQPETQAVVVPTATAGTPAQ